MLRLSTDRKVTPLATLRGGKWYPEVKNTFGLPASHCVGRTEFCDQHCYAERIEGYRPSVRKLLEANWEAIKDHPDRIHGPIDRHHYGMREIGIRDPDGHFLVFAEDMDEEDVREALLAVDREEVRVSVKKGLERDVVASTPSTWPSESYRG